MSAKRLSFAINNIKKSIEFLKKTDEDIFDNTLKSIGFNKQVYEKCYLHDLYTLMDIEYSLDKLISIYENNADQLMSLSRNIRKVCKNYSGGNQLGGYIPKRKIITKNIKSKKVIVKRLTVHEKLLKEIENRAYDCCLCLTFGELSKITENEFIRLMRSQFRKINGHVLEESRIRSWRDEYRQFNKAFIPIFKKADTYIMEFHIIFELKLPLQLTDLDSETFVYSDAVIVGNKGTVVLEFKQLDSKTIDFDAKQALKYMHRLRYHKCTAHHHHRYTYIIYTKEQDNTVYCYGKKQYFWYGNPIGIANDLVSQYLIEDDYCTDIEGWLRAGYWQKKKKQ